MHRAGTFYLDYDGNGRWDGPEVDRLYRFGNGTDTPIIGAWAESPVSVAALRAASAPPADHPAPEPLTLADVQPVVEEAMLYLPPELEGVSIYVQMVDLPGLMVAQASGNTIRIDPHAAGFGWFTEPTRTAFEPGEQPGQLVAHPGSEAALRIDLLTAVLHEMYHLAGHGHDGDGLMQPALEPGVRLLPPADLDPADAAALEAAWAVSPHEALAWLDELAAANRRRREEQSEQSLHVQAVDEALKLYWQ